MVSNMGASLHAASRPCRLRYNQLLMSQPRPSWGLWHGSCKCFIGDAADGGCEGWWCFTASAVHRPNPLCVAVAGSFSSLQGQGCCVMQPVVKCKSGEVVWQAAGCICWSRQDRTVQLRPLALVSWLCTLSRLRACVRAPNLQADACLWLMPTIHLVWSCGT